jgi:AcrR family transcriptional regulator
MPSRRPNGTTENAGTRDGADYPVVTVSALSQSQSSSTPRLTATARREQLLDVALGVFARNGYHDTSMNDVADAAGVTKPVLYQHFDSKRELYQALLDEVSSRLLTAIVTAAGGAKDGREQTERGFQAYFRWVAEDHDAFMLLYGGGTRRDDDFARAVRRVTATAAAAIAPLIAIDIDLEHRLTLAHALIASSSGATASTRTRSAARSATWRGPVSAASAAPTDPRDLGGILANCRQNSRPDPGWHDSRPDGGSAGLEDEAAVAVGEAGGLGGGADLVPDR